MSDIEARVKKSSPSNSAWKSRKSPMKRLSWPTWVPTRSTRWSLVMALEDEFGIEIPDEDAEKITTVQNAIDYANTHQKA